MKRILVISIFCLILVPLASRSAAPQLTTFPSVDPKSSQYLLLVVDRVKYRGELPESEACRDPSAICMDAPPFWFSANVLESVYGESPEKEISIATTSHYGPMLVKEWRGPALVALVTSGNGFVMLRYAMRETVAGKNGKQFLFVDGAITPWWLPCSAAAVVKPIKPNDLMVPSRYIRPESELTEGDRDSYAKVNGGYFPKSAIEYSDLSKLLKREKKKAPIEFCDR